MVNDEAEIVAREMIEPKLETELSREAKAWLQGRIAQLAKEGWSPSEDSKNFQPEFYLLKRIADFRFDDYPSYTAPWHLLRWPHMRWEHVYHIVTLIELMKQPTGADMGKPIILQPFQILILLCFLGPEDPETGLRKITEGLLTLGRKQGKLLRLDELIPTPDGWVRNGNLKRGDAVFGVDGKPCRVMEAFPPEVPGEAYRLTFSDGAEIESGADHQWLTRHRWRPWVVAQRGLRKGKNGVNGRPVEEVVTTQQIYESLIIPRSDEQVEWNHSIGLCGPVDYPERDLPVDPYTLGVWLAEGSLGTSHVTLSDEDRGHITGRISQAYGLSAPRPGNYTTGGGGCKRYMIGEWGQLFSGLSELGVRHERGIPEDYLLASVEQRRALLQGLLDGDGYASRARVTESTVEITQKSTRLAGEILELVRSLGFKPASTLRPGKINGEVVGHYHRITFTAYREDDVFSLPRKRGALKPHPGKVTRARRRQIVKCEPVNPVPMRCIMVDGPSNLYLTGKDYLVTHNSMLVSTLVLALMTIHPDHHGLRGQEIQVGAADREQAGICHKMISRCIVQDEDIGIRDKFHVVPSKKHIQHKGTLTEFHAVSSEAFRAHGANSVFVLMDEVGNISNPLAKEFYAVLTSGFGAQKEPMTFMFSTQAPVDEHFFSQQCDRAKRINEGLLEDPTFAGFVFTVPEQDEGGIEFPIHDPRWWYLANPGLGTIASLKDMQDWSRKARDLPDLENKFRNLKLNQRVSQTASFLSRRVWERNNTLVDPVDLYGWRCWAGIDLAETTDLASLMLLFEPLPGQERQAIMPFFWIPGEGLEARSDRDKVPYTTWSKQGLIDTQSALTVDYGRIADKLEELAGDYDIRALGVDRWRWNQLELALKDKDMEFTKDDKTLFIIGQGYRDAPTSIELLETDALEGRLAHGGHPILRWCIANSVTTKDPAGNRKFDKSKSYGRIDGTIALAMARRARHEQDLTGEEPSMYDDPNRAMIM